MSTPSPPPAPVLNGALLVKISRCVDLEKKRLMSAMDPYVKLDCGGAEKFKTKTHENGDRAPVWDQSFLFNLTGKEKETDLHLRVMDSELLSDAYVGRADIPLMNLLVGGGGESVHDLSDPENFRRITGRIYVTVSFTGTGGPPDTVELPPISGLFHMQSNASGLIVHAVGDKLQMRAGGINNTMNAFEWQGTSEGGYIRFVPDSRYVAGSQDGSLVLRAGISADAKFRFTGIGMQHVASSKLVHPIGDALAINTELCIASGGSAASGFSLIACAGTISSPVPVSPPAVNPYATPNAITPQPTHAPQYPSLQPVRTAATGWTCSKCTFENVASRAACEMCSQARPSSSGSAIHDTFNLDQPASTFPLSVSVRGKHPHPLNKLSTIYQGTYDCNACGLQGQGTVYHCGGDCNYDMHPACAHRHRTN